MPSDTFTLQIFDTGISTPALHASTHLTGGSDAISTAVASVAGVGGSAGLMSALQAEQLVTNNGKVTNATHTGDVTGSTALTIGANKVTSVNISDGAVVSDKIATGAVTTTKIAAGNVTLAKLANVDGPVVLGRSATDVGEVTAISCTTAGFDFISQANVSSMRTYLELGSLATLSTVDLTANVGTSVLPTANGGTGTAGGLLAHRVLVSGTTTGGAFGVLPEAASTQILVGGGPAAYPVWTTATGTGAPVRSIGPTFVTPYLGTPSSGVLTNCTGLPLTTGVTGVLPIANGGTGPSAFGQLYSQTPATAAVAYTIAYTKVSLATTFDDSNSINFSSEGLNNHLRYFGTATRRFLVSADLDMLDDVLGEQFSIAIYKGSGAGTPTIVEPTKSNSSIAQKSSGTGVAQMTSSWIISLATDDFVELFVSSVGGSFNGTPQRMRLVATPVF